MIAWKVPCQQPPRVGGIDKETATLRHYESHFDEFMEDGFRMSCSGKEKAFGNVTTLRSWMESIHTHPTSAPPCPIEGTALDGKTTDLAK